MPCHAKAWKFKRLLLQNKEPFGTEILSKQRFLGAVIPRENRNSQESIIS